MTDEIDWYGPEAATFGDRVAAAREQTGMTQAMLAKRLGVRLATLRGWEEDLSEPRANRLSMLAGLLNVSMMWLIDGEGEGVEKHARRGVVTAELVGRGQNGRHQGVDHQDPDQHRNIPENLDVDRHQFGHEPVLGQACHTGDHTQNCRSDTGQKRNKKRVDDTDHCGTQVR